MIAVPQKYAVIGNVTYCTLFIELQSMVAIDNICEQ